MVRVRDYVNKDGETKHEIKLAGMGEEEEVRLTVKVDEVYEGEVKAGVSKNTGKAYSAFQTYGVGAIYHKGEEEIDTWVKLTKLSAKELNKLKFKAEDIVIAYKVPGKKGDYVTFRKDGEAKPSTSTSQSTNQVHSVIKPEFVEAATPASNIPNISFAKATSYEQQLVTQALGSDNDYKPADVKFNLQLAKDAGSDVLDTSIERVEWLVEQFKPR